MEAIGGAGDMAGLVLLNLLRNKKQASTVPIANDGSQIKGTSNTQSAGGTGRNHSSSQAISCSKSRSSDNAVAMLTHNVHGNAALKSYKLMAESTQALSAPAGISIKA